MPHKILRYLSISAGVLALLLAAVFLYPKIIKADITTGLVGYWNFDEGSGTTAADSSGNNSTGTLTNGPTWTSGQINSALSFDGVDDYVQVGAKTSLNFGVNNPWSFSSWMYITQCSTMRYIGPKGQGGAFLSIESYNCGFAYREGGGSYTIYYFAINSAQNIFNRWTHIVFVADGNGNLTLYKDGVYSETITGLARTDFRPYNIGEGYDGKPLKGSLDEVRIYNRALSTSEVQELYNYTGGGTPTPTPSATPTPTPSGTPTLTPTPSPTPDTTPPVRSNGSPSGTLPSGTTQTTLSLSTNENATCKYSTAANTAYASMANTFSTTGSTNHSTSITGLINGNIYNYYIRCQDTANNANINDFQISFSIAQSGSAACSWNGNTGTVASPYAASDVQACITDAAGKTGDVIVQIPDSSVTWASSVSVDMQSGWTNINSLTIRGQNDCTTTATTRMVPSANNFQYPTSCGTNIANMKLYYTGKLGKKLSLLHLKVTGTSGVTIDGNGKSWRFGYIIWENLTGAFQNRVFWIQRSQLDWMTEGVIDHNYATFPTNVGQLVFWYVFGNAEYIAPFDLGGSSAAYLENSKITYGSGGGSITDSNGGGRTVVRYCESTNAYIGGHDDRMRPSGMRGFRKTEVYGSYFDLSAGGNYWMYYMAGNGVYFNNTVIGSSLAFDLHVTRAEEAGHGTCGNTTSGNDYLGSVAYVPVGDNSGCTLGVNGCIKVDGTAVSPNGWPCRDQIGSSGNDPQIGGGAPFLLWGDTLNGGAFLTPLASSYVINNRDFCIASTCSGTTCSYTCGSTTVNYTAYAHPHPLTLTVSDTTPPAAPTGVAVQ